MQNAAAVFLSFRQKNNHPFRNGAKIIAEYKPEEKDTVVKLLMNCSAV